MAQNPQRADRVARILVVDDDRSIRRTLEKLLLAEGYDVETADDGRDVASRAAGMDLVLLDLGLPTVDGLSVLGSVHAPDPSGPAFIVITAREDMQSTVEAMRLGAHDCLIKPLDIDRLLHAVRRAVASRRATGSRHAITLPDDPPGDGDALVGHSRAMREVFKTIGALATSRVTVLIQGESGTGKELVARALHQAGDTSPHPFVGVNCSALPRDLLESELFGHVRGAFTGATADRAGRLERAGNGTLFLDEIGEIPLSLQVKLLRVLQERVYERVGHARPLPMTARIVAATHRDLSAMAREGSFREDLLFRLQVMVVKLPPLRERPEDIEPLVRVLLRRIGRELGRPIRFVSNEAMRRLMAYHWPGNVRELENALTRAVVLTKGEVIEADLLPLPAPAEEPARPADEPPLTLREVEARHVAHMLRLTGWNKRQASRLLGISRPTLDRKIEDFGLRPER